MPRTKAVKARTTTVTVDPTDHRKDRVISYAKAVELYQAGKLSYDLTNGGWIVNAKTDLKEL